MENMKAQIECKLVAIQLEDLCKHKEGIIYDASLSTQERVIRLQTPISWQSQHIHNCPF